MAKKKFNSKLYHIEKLVYEKNVGYYYEEDPDGYLFSNFLYPTKIKPEDLPDWYVFGRYYKRWGFLSAKGVKGIFYKPNLWMNHLLKNDLLFISYEYEKINETDVLNYDYNTFDYLISGNVILEFLNALRIYSPNVSIENTKELLKLKVKTLKEKHPHEFEDWDFDVDEYFSYPYQKIEYRSN